MTSQKYLEYREMLRRGQYLAASRLAELEYLEDNRNNPFWLTRQAAALTRAKKFEQALDIAKQALSLQPSNPYSILAAAEALYGLNRTEEALQHYEEIDGEPKLVPVAQKGILDCLSKLKQWDRMLQKLSEWEMPQNTRLRWKVRALSGLNRLEEAIEFCSQWLELTPDDTGAVWAMTDLEIRRDGLEAVRVRMCRLAKISSRPPIYKEIYASLCRKAGKPELALEEYAKISRQGADARIQRQQAFALAKSGRETEAIPMAEELLKADPKDHFIHKSYIAACSRIRQLDRALAFYEALIQMHPEEKPLFGRIRTVKNKLGIKE